ncbi:glutamine-hydrolyzing GMP synthase [Sporosarcina thermotolerans]|uniref:GMP synthase (glutamine-hydrolyzing) n=1 Tax=Sporosarcina thermotolerans TaxID=633404 RepID=A0AAW9A864_9BACL|nr:glutamine-hydrolyzing GMP synthase [Sporosarcina thermotolerans]MDW0117627.1 glutamine-hydrolyzing GMP synthase [Sporosarcina thermotolerans]WHT49275.1 glutamine-hydrolyzing GMP synthase [Sporosarcina thermotolerans]
MSTAPLLIEQEKIVVIDFGSKYNQLITRTIRELGVYSELHPHTVTAEELKSMQAVGIILAGGEKEDMFSIDSSLFDLGIPVLGIESGAQFIVKHFGGASELLDGFSSIDEEKQLYGMRLHPDAEKTDNLKGKIQHFVEDICETNASWSMQTLIEIEVEKIRSQVGDRKVLCALSGGVDSSVVAALIHRAIGDQLTCIFVDHGLLRKFEVESVVDTFSNQFHMNFIKVDARTRFLDKLKGVTDPEQKRKIIGNEFIYVFDEESAKLEGIDFLAQGTIYADIIESGTATKEVIKSHHNVGGLPEDMEFELIEPLKALFKDEVRAVGAELGLPSEIVHRQPFPGPGLGVRVLGEITEEKLDIVREADWILRDEIAKAGLDREIWQYFAILPDIRSVGVRNEKRSYDYAVGLRAVHSVDGMTADWARIPWDILEKISTRITTEVDHVNRVVYDITGKPPGTIEWE